MEYTNSQMLSMINEYIHSQRDREILCRRLIDGMTYELMAEEFTLTPRQLKTIVYKNEKIIFSHFPG